MSLPALLVALTLALPAAAIAQEARPAFGLDPAKFGLMSLDPQVFGALKRALTPAQLTALGYDSFDAAAQSAHVEIAGSDCPRGCNAELDRGLCLCLPATDGTCPPGAAAATRGGKSWCSALPDTVTIFASDGGLGTTRVSLTGG